MSVVPIATNNLQEQVYIIIEGKGGKTREGKMNEVEEGQTWNSIFYSSPNATIQSKIIILVQDNFYNVTYMCMILYVHIATVYVATFFRCLCSMVW